MSITADVSIPTKSFALHETLTAVPEATIEAERLATHSAEWVMPFLWMTGGDSETFYEELRTDSTVVNATIIEETNDSTLYRIVWENEIIEIINEMIDQDATILEAKATGDVWRLKVRFAEKELVSSFRNYFVERGYEFEVNHIISPANSRQSEFGLTKQQYEALVTATQNGYFDIPRSVTNEELAEILGISSNATSQRIRRASANLVRNTLIIGADTE